MFGCLTRVMRATVPIPAVPSVSVLHSAVVGGSVASLRYPLSVFNKNSTLNPTPVYTVPTLPPSPTLLSLVSLTRALRRAWWRRGEV